MHKGGNVLKKLKPPMLAAIGALFLIIILGMSLYLSGVAYQTPDDIISLSDIEPSSTDIDMLEQNLVIAGQVKVDETNVKQLINSLKRPEKYTATISNMLYYGDVSGAISCKQSVMDNACRVDYLTQDGNIDYTQIYFDDICYTFKQKSDSFRQIPMGDFTWDSTAMIPTYETILQISDEYITGSRMYQENGEILIEVDTQIGENIGIYRISLKNGLLYSADFSKSGKMTRKLEVSVSSELPKEDDFILPSQTTPIYEK